MKTDAVEKDDVGESAAANDGRGGTLRAVGPFKSCLQIAEELTGTNSGYHLFSSRLTQGRANPHFLSTCPHVMLQDCQGLLRPCLASPSQ